MKIKELPLVLDCLEALRQRIENRSIAVFLDYDGTLTPIVSTPDQARISNEMRKTVSELASQCTVAVISGRDLREVRTLVGLEQIIYAGSHGFEIEGPESLQVNNEQGLDFLPVLDLVEGELRRKLEVMAGSLVERKKFSIAVHYRNVKDEDVSNVESVVNQLMFRYPQLRKAHGKKVHDLQPKIDWHKGKAVLWLLEALHLDRPDACPVYIGDDTTDEHAFEVLVNRGVGIVVGSGSRETAACYALRSPDDLRRLLRTLASMLEART